MLHMLEPPLGGGRGFTSSCTRRRVLPLLGCSASQRKLLSVEGERGHFRAEVKVEYPSGQERTVGRTKATAHSLPVDFPQPIRLSSSFTFLLTDNELP